MKQLKFSVEISIIFPKSVEEASDMYLNVQICIQMIQFHHCEFSAYVFRSRLEFIHITLIEAR